MVLLGQKGNLKNAYFVYIYHIFFVSSLLTENHIIWLLQYFSYLAKWKNSIFIFTFSKTFVFRQCKMRVYRRSVKKHNIYFDSFICDEDSSDYTIVVKEVVYGAWKTIRKEECVNHISKRMGTGIRTIGLDCKVYIVRSYFLVRKCFPLNKQTKNSIQITNPIYFGQKAPVCFRRSSFPKTYLSYLAKFLLFLY